MPPLPPGTLFSRYMRDEVWLASAAAAKRAAAPSRVEFFSWAKLANWSLKARIPDLPAFSCGVSATTLSGPAGTPGVSATSGCPSDGLGS
jgi:hypothetical protein